MKSKRKKKIAPAKQNQAVEILKLIFFFVYVGMLAGSVYGIWRLMQPKPTPAQAELSETLTEESPELSSSAERFNNLTSDNNENSDVKKP